MVLLLALTTALGAHPHMWIDTIIEPNFSTSGLESIEVQWTFDSFFSSSLIIDADANGNGRLEGSEQQWLRENVFIHLQELNFFFQLEKDGQDLRLPVPRGFSASIEGQSIRYNFTFDLPYRWSEIQNLRIINFDQSYYTSFAVDAQMADEAPRTRGRIALTEEEWETDGWGLVPLTTVVISSE